mmetsp:Transcript_8162/g.20033  ORF Transcript_8162/g.20033 Transcript_8162/m.20033 type:complete len:162 (+) Transcript_8162:168-653(+)
MPTLIISFISRPLCPFPPSFSASMRQSVATLPLAATLYCAFEYKADAASRSSSTALSWIDCVKEIIIALPPHLHDVAGEEVCHGRHRVGVGVGLPALASVSTPPASHPRYRPEGEATMFPGRDNAREPIPKCAVLGVRVELAGGITVGIVVAKGAVEVALV